MELSVTGEYTASILRQVLEACELATEDLQARYGAVREAVVCLNTMKLDELDQVTLASDLHRIVREATGNPDPYRELKRMPTGLPPSGSRDSRNPSSRMLPSRTLFREIYHVPENWNRRL